MFVSLTFSVNQSIPTRQLVAVDVVEVPVAFIGSLSIMASVQTGTYMHPV